MQNKRMRESTKSQKSTESASRKSKRYRKSSSSSSDSTDDEQTHKTSQAISKNGSDTEKITDHTETAKSPKENENSKRSLAKSQRSSSTRRSTRKSENPIEEDSTKSSPRKSRRRGHSDEHTRDNKKEEKDDKTSKGKSKSKTKSKNEKQAKIQDIQTKSESEISENVQVTSQSPHANFDNPVDNNTEHDENEIKELNDVTAPVTESKTKQFNTSDSNDSKYQQRDVNDSDETSQNVEDEKVTSGDRDTNEGSMEWQSVEQEVVLEGLPVDDSSEVVVYQEEVVQAETNDDSTGHAEPRSRHSSSDAGDTQQNRATDPAIIDNESTNAEAVPPQSDEDSRSVDAIILHESSNTPPRDNKFILSQSYNSDVQCMESVNDEIQNIKNEVAAMFETPPPKPERRHKWGDSLAGLELIKPSLKNITLNTIKEFCPNVTFLEENETRLAAEHREKKIDRRISMDYKSDEDSSRKYDTQSSHEENSEIDNSNIIALNRKISIVEDTASKLRPPPSPARNPVSPILYITNLVRPFTLKHLKELLERTGRIRENGFWTDRIKSKCYVHYESSEYAEATRNALHGVNWPIGNGKQLIIEYSTADEFEKARNPAPTPAAPEKPSHTEKENIDIEKQIPVKRTRHEEPERVPKEKERHRSEPRVREWEPPREEIRNRRSRSRRHSRTREIRHDSRERNDRRRGRRSMTPPDYRSKKQKIKEEEPQKLMDDLFHKTKAVPSIYWLPLTPEEIATKQQERLLRMAEHKRRIEESARNRGDHGRGAPYRRRYD